MNCMNCGAFLTDSDLDYCPNCGYNVLIQKKVEQGRTFTEIEPLDENGRVHALAKIISGDHITDLSLANAKEMIETARMTPQKKYTG